MQEQYKQEQYKQERYAQEQYTQEQYKQEQIEYYDLSGVWQADIGDGKLHEMKLPGSLDENGIGYEDTGSNQWHPDADLGNKQVQGAADMLTLRPGQTHPPILTRFTRKYTFQGCASISRTLTFSEHPGKRLFLEVERARVLKLLVDDREVAHFLPPALNTPHVFEVTGLLEGTHTLTFLSDNSYPGLPAKDIIYSSTATDETQTNWNGLLGYVRLREEEAVFIQAVRVYTGQDTLSVCVELASDKEETVQLRVKPPAAGPESAKGAGALTRTLQLTPGITEYWLREIPLTDALPCWDEKEGELLELTAFLDNGSRKTAIFGKRLIGWNGQGQLTLNGRAIFLRSEVNCAVFPETGYCPMTVEEWKSILAKYASYGVNCMRFHSHCPPEAAFTAADRMGMLMQPELSHWNPVDAFETQESASYYETELVQTLKYLANHPSFVMFTLGNELHCGEKGHRVMDHLMDLARGLDSTRLYANGSNVHYGALGCDEKSDFYTSFNYYDEMLRGTSAASDEKGMAGHINRSYPNAETNYNGAMRKLRKAWQKPVYEFEVGQFEVLPDFGELEQFHGISSPDNLQMVKDRAEALGLLEKWPAYVEATGELSLIGYREEIEAALRTEGISGVSLLGIQDFPGQGTALVGMLDSHLQSKPYSFAQPQRFQAFFRERLPLVLLPKYTYENTETLRAGVKLSNYGKEPLTGHIHYLLREKCHLKQEVTSQQEASPGQEIPSSRSILWEGDLPEVFCPVGHLTEAGVIELAFAVLAPEVICEPAGLELLVSFIPSGEAPDTGERFGGGSIFEPITNTYPLWVYPPVQPVCPQGIYEARQLDEQVRSVLQQGGTVYLTPPATKEAMPCSIKTQFTTDFWSVGTFPAQEGSMGQLIDAGHPLFDHFPTESHTNWQWWPMAVSRALILPRPCRAIITEMDSYAYMRPMAQLLEVRCLKGRLLLSSMGLPDLQQYPEARALQQAIYTYLDAKESAQLQEMSWEELTGLLPFHGSSGK